MKNNTLLIMICIAFLQLSPQIVAQDLFWEKSFGGREAEFLSDAEPTADYGFILGGSSLSKKSGVKEHEGSGDLDYLIWKMDESGKSEWQKSYGGAATDMLNVLKNTSDGGFILGGVSNSGVGFDKKEDARGANDIWIIKLDAKGNEMWQRTYGGKGQEELASLIPTTDGGFLIGGSSTSQQELDEKIIGRKKENNRGSLDYWIIKLDKDGNEEWQQTYGGKYADVLQSMCTTKDGGYLVGGYSNSPNSKDKSEASLGSGNDFWLLKLNAEGTIEWQKALGGSGEDQLKVVCQALDGNYMIAGQSNSVTRTSKNGSDLWVVKLDVNGLLLWEKAYNIGKNDVLTSFMEEADGTFLIGAYSPSSYEQGSDEEGINDYVALKTTASGEELWRKVYGSKGEDVLKKIIQTRDEGYLMIGTSNPEFNGHGPINNNSSLTQNLNPLTTSEQLAGAKKVQDEMDAKVNEYATSVNDAIKDKSTAITDQINQKIDENNKSRFKVGLSGPAGDLLNPTKAGGVAQGNSFGPEKAGPKPGAKISRDKKVNYGGKDYWVVKLKDKEKKAKEKVTIEAYPNPTSSFTNVIIGFEYDSGTASVYDLGGRELQNFKIEDRTVPVNLSEYPIGIYIISIKTNKGEGSVKVIKE